MRNRFVVTALLFAFLPLVAAEITGQKLPDSTTVHSPFALEVTVNKAPTQKVVPDEAAGWVKTLRIDGVQEEVSDSSVTFTYTMAAYAPQTCSIPSFKLFVVPVDSTDTTGTDTLSTEPTSIVVGSRFEMANDSMLAAGFGEPMKAGKFPIEYIFYLLGLILLGLIVILLLVALVRWIIMKRQNRTFWGEPAVPAVPPYEEAIAALKEYDELNLVQQGELKEAIFLLSEILKRYIGRRYECHVQESTSSEFRAWIKECDLNREQCNMLERFISETDPVKFAGIIPNSSVVNSFYDEISAFVKETKPAEEEDQK